MFKCTIFQDASIMLAKGMPGKESFALALARHRSHKHMISEGVEV